MTSPINLIKQIHQGQAPIDVPDEPTTHTEEQKKKPHTVNHYIGTKALEEVE